MEADEDLDLDKGYVLVPWSAIDANLDDQNEDGDVRGEGEDGRDDEGIPPGHLPPPDEREPMDCSELPPGQLPPPEDRDELCLDYDDEEDDFNGDDDALEFRFDTDILADGPGFAEEDLDDLETGGWEEEVGEFWRGYIGDLPEMEEEEAFGVALDQTQLENLPQFEDEDDLPVLPGLEQDEAGED